VIADELCRVGGTCNLTLVILLLIAFGGAAGSVLRYLIGGRVQHFAPHGFPVGTLFVNVLGCFLIGVFVRQFMNVQIHNYERAFLVVGFCGGFTTFSTFSIETIGLIEGGEYPRALAYITLSVLLCLTATAAGMGAGRLFAGTGHAR
jgi:fluoride exporter